MSTYWPTVASWKVKEKDRPQEAQSAYRDSPTPGAWSATPTAQSSEYKALQDAYQLLKPQLDSAPNPGDLRALREALAQGQEEGAALRSSLDLHEHDLAEARTELSAAHQDLEQATSQMSGQQAALGEAKTTF